MSWFHTRDGLYFASQPYGDVKFVVTKDQKLPEDDKSNVAFEVTLGRGTLASLMASACARGYTSESFYEAYNYLQTK